MPTDNLNSHIDPDPELIKEFLSVWENYPYPAALIHKSKIIIAANKASIRGGRMPGMNCSKWGSLALHRGCLAARTLEEQIPLNRESRNKKEIKRFCWLPLSQFPDYYIHFTVIITKLNK